MGKRIVTAIIGLPVLAAVIFTGGPTLYTALFFLTILGLMEFYQGFEMKKREAAYIGYGLTLLLYVTLWNQAPAFHPLTLVAGLICLMLGVWVIRHRQIEWNELLIAWFGFSYVAILLFHLVLIDRMSISYAIWLVFLISWASDTAAYLTGMLIGRHKLCPSVSPKKTVEGAAGGMAGSTFGCYLFAMVIVPEHTAPLMIMGMLGSAVSQMGDLAASLIKRKAGIKDFGRVFPGHGGVLDRFDSILFTAPFVYYFIGHWVSGSFG